jgi:hypothetical protein
MKYRCNICNEEFKELIDYKFHLGGIHDKHICDNCENYYETGEELEKHETENEEYSCEECDYKTKKRFNYNRHIKNVHNRENTEYYCDFRWCIFKTNYKTNLVRHMKKIHFIDDEMRCPFKNENNCRYRAYFQKDLEKHIDKVHNKLEKYKKDYKYK